MSLNYLYNYNLNVPSLTTGNFVSTNITVNNVYYTGNLIQNGTSSSVLGSSNNFIATNLSAGTLNAGNLTTGNINFTGTLSQNGTVYLGSQWTTTASNLSYTSGNVIVNNLTTGNLNFTGGLFQNGIAYVGSQWTSTAGNSLSYTSGNVVITNLVNTNASIGNISSANISISGNMTVGGNLLVAGSLISVNVTSNNIIDNNISAGTLNSVAATIGNLNSTNVTTNSLIATTVSSGSISSVNNTVVNLNTTNITSTNIFTTGFTSTNLLATNNTLTNTIFTNFTVGTLLANNLNLGTSSFFSGSFVASNNISSATNVTGLVFNSTNINYFEIKISVSIIATANLQQTYNLYGNFNASGWSLFTNYIGDTTGVVFSITAGGQIQYTSTNVTGFVSDTFRYTVQQFSASGTYTSLAATTQGNYIFNTVQVTSTTDSVIGTSVGGIQVLGGATIAKQLNIQATSGATGIGSGGTLTVFGGAAISSNMIIGSGVNSSFNSNTIGNIFTTGGNVGIGNANPGFTLDISGTGRFTNAFNASFNSNTIGGTIFTTGGNVGIDTSAPSAYAQLTINGGNSGISTTQGNIAFSYAPATGYYHFINSRHNGAVSSNQNAIDFYLNNTSTQTGSSAPNFGNVNSMSVTATGIGIFNSNPVSVLTINPVVIDSNAFDHSIAPLTITQNSSTGTSVLNDQSPVLHLTRQGKGAQAYGLRSTFALSRYENIGVNSRTRLDIGLSQNFYDTVYVMSVRADGNIGINNTAPAFNLDITGTARITGSLTTGNVNITNGTLVINSSMGNVAPFTPVSVVNTNQNGIAGINLYNNLYNAYIGIGGTSYASANNVNNLFIQSPTNMLLSANGVTGYPNIYIAANSNVGINTSNPGYILDVNGTTRIIGSLTSGSHLITAGGLITSLNSSNTLGNIYTTGGNIGINTTQPGYLLDIAGSINTSTVLNVNSGQNVPISINTSYSGAFTTLGYLFAPNQTNGNNNCSTRIFHGQGIGANYNSGQIGFNYISNNNIANFASFSIYGVSPTLNVNGSGNVGIGTTAPSYTLDITGSSRVTTRLDIGGTQPSFTSNTIGKLFITGTNNTPNGPHILMNTNQDQFPTFQLLNYQHDNISLNFDYYYDGSWRTSSSNTAFTINKFSNALTFGYVTGSAGSSNTATGAMIIGSTGNVGFGGQTTPIASLDINGQQYFSNGVAAPPTQSILGGTGAKITLFAGTSSFTPYGLGVQAFNTWYSSAYGHMWYTGTTNPSMQLTAGNLIVTGDIAGFGTISDERLKTNVMSINNALDTVNSLRPVTFNWRDDIFNKEHAGTSDSGFIAQEVEPIIPHAIGNYTDITTENVYKNMRHERIIPYLTAAIQELILKQQALQDEIDLLKGKGI